VTLCERCGKPIGKTEKSDPVDKFSNSGGGVWGRVHRTLCQRPPAQTYPADGTRRIRGR
jgi:hypothetical protein